MPKVVVKAKTKATAFLMQAAAAFVCNRKLDRFLSYPPPNPKLLFAITLAKKSMKKNLKKYSELTIPAKKIEKCIQRN